MKLIDLTGQRFGRLTVIEKDCLNTNKGTYWICKCDCGEYISTRRDTLLREKNKKTSCGCDAKEKNKTRLKDETGNRYGYLTVLYRVENSNKKGPAKWHCKCDCGNECDVTGNHLRNGTTQSCGCKRYESKNYIEEMTGARYGKLTILYKSNKSKNGKVIWHCKCDCGNECDVLGCNLRSGVTTSCGCQKSRGEQKIVSILTENNINFKREFTFNDLYGDNAKLRFDFGILDKKNELQYLIEFDGIQHFEPKGFSTNKNHFKKLKKYDKIKNDYCKENNLKLIRIPYYKLDTLTIDDLILKGDDENNE